MHSKYAYPKFTGLFILSFGSIGFFLPLLSIYLADIGLSGIQIGILTSIGSFMTIISPPFWSTICEITKRPKLILLTAIISSALLGLTLYVFKSFWSIFLIFTILYFFFNSILPLLDSFTLRSSLAYGKVRKWGAFGFSMASLISSYLTKSISISIIFLLFSMALFILFLLTLTVEIPHVPVKHNEKGSLSVLIKDKRFLIFLLITFLVNGPIAANNVYMGLLLKNVGATSQIVGIAFTLFALSEVPFMQIVAKQLDRFGVENILIFSIIVGIIRWTFYATSPAYIWIILLFPIQGIFYGSYIVGSAEYIKRTFSPHLHQSGIALYTSMGFGLGAIIFNNISGALYDYWGAQAIYILFTSLTILGLIIMLFLKSKSKQ